LASELIRQLKEYLDQVRSRLDDASFEDKRRSIDLLEINGKFDFENNERVIYIKCLISQPNSRALKTTFENPNKKWISYHLKKAG
jgi:hypothetical protein